MSFNIYTLLLIHLFTSCIYCTLDLRAVVENTSRNGKVSYNKYPDKEQYERSKVEYLGQIFKKHVQRIRGTEGGKSELVFLVDSSGSVGADNFRDELMFVRRLLSDFTVDQDHTRVAVITYSSRRSVRRHVDHLRDADNDHHKCSLLKEELPRIDYIGGGTYTIGAFREAQSVLQAARQESHKVVFLITDGFSNGGDPRPLAEQLRRAGVEVFTIGIKNGNPVELFEMASEPKPEHCYILDDFDEFEALARRALHEDLHSGRYLNQSMSLCDDLCDHGGSCCDVNARCSCGTHTGLYECLCLPGYYGNGLKGQCSECPAGTYKSDAGSGDVSICTRCPDVNHVTVAGSRSVDACACKPGFHDLGRHACAATTCPKLEPPEHGYFVRNNCNNVIHAACGVRCHPGYKLIGSSLRLCLETGNWSGTPAACQVKQCSQLSAPDNGEMTCTTGDFSFGTICHFECTEGFTLLGTTSRQCLSRAVWDGILARCRPVSCEPLGEIADGTVSPAECQSADMAYGSSCKMRCKPGYQLRGSDTTTCAQSGRWEPLGRLDEKCIDVTPPSIRCPADFSVDAEDEDGKAYVTWSLPPASDNSGQVPILSVIPALVPPARLPIGKAGVNYFAEDKRGNKARCSFVITIQDVAAPRVDECVSPPPFTLQNGDTQIDWHEPEFSDNSREPLIISASHQRDDFFPIGTTDVVYTAYDQAGNNNTCIIHVTVQEHACANPATPLNGNITCVTETEGVECQLRCMPGYGFANPPPDVYKCSYDTGQWQPADKMPFPDCSVSLMSNEVVQPSEATLKMRNVCGDRSRLNRLENRFYNAITRKVEKYCHPNVICAVQHVETTCLDTSHDPTDEGEDDNQILTNVIGQNLLPSRRRRHLAKEVINDVSNRDSVKIRFQIAGSLNRQVMVDKEGQSELVAQVKYVVRMLQGDVTVGDVGPLMTDSDIQFDSLALRQPEPHFMCAPGTVLQQTECVKCPIGTYFDVITEECTACERGSYQPQEGALTCLVCPTNTSTSTDNAKSINQCKGQCLPGTFSEGGLERCDTCHRGYYQPEYAQTGCIPCDEPLTTWKRGARQAGECGVKCPAGNVSRTGLEPCFPCPRGYFQPDEGKSSCLLCPGSVNTRTEGATNITDCIGVRLEDMGDLSNVPTTELEVNDCFEEPCQNQAVCSSLPMGYTCHCAPGWTGVHCESDIDECESHPCENNATCRNLQDEFLCICPPGYNGVVCEMDIDECSSSPCYHGSTCLDEVNGYTCQCAQGYNGTFCEEDIDDCLSSPCQNEAECEDDVAGFHCECRPGYRGNLCDVNIDECASSPCNNDATCVDGVNSVQCLCLAGFEGDLCEIDIDECGSFPCQNEATCFDDVNGYTCGCPPGFGDINCATELSYNYTLEFEATTRNDYVMLAGFYDNLTEVSLAFWVQTSDDENQGSVLSYATTNSSNTFTLLYDTGFVIYVNDETVFTDVKCHDGRWHHIVVTWVSPGGLWQIYKDGQLVQQGEGLATDQYIPAGGTLVLGQEQDNEGGDFDLRQAYVGSLYALNIWDRLLSAEDVLDMSGSCQQWAGTLKAWPDFQTGLHGGVTLTQSTFCQGCGRPEVIEHGSVTWNGTSVGSSVASYSCDVGYELVGASSRLCLISSHWQSDTPTCQIRDCGFPGSIRHGYINGFRYTYGSSISYSCYDGYRIQGNDTRICGADGGWMGDKPSCIEVLCELSLPQHMRARPGQVAYRPGEEVRMSCTSGYRLTGRRTLTCEPTGQWNRELPNCRQIVCEDPPEIPNGHALVEAGRSTSVGDNITYVCDEGFRMLAADILACRKNGQWANTVPVCGLLQCAAPPNLHHGSIYIEESNSRVKNVYGTTVIYTCDIGYKMVSNLQDPHVIKCERNGYWNSSEPVVCEQIVCPPPATIKYGTVTVFQLTFNASVTYSCEPGFFLVGESVHMCGLMGEWDGGLPECVKRSCDQPEAPEHGQVIGSHFEFEDIIRVVCEDGYVGHGDLEIQCGPDGAWETDIAECVRMTCPHLNEIDNGKVIGDGHRYGDQVDYTCDAGFLLVGERSRFCQSNATWSGGQPMCQRITCSQPLPIANGTILTEPRNFQPGDVVRYGCDPGFDLHGKPTRTCRADGTWTGPTPKCDLVKCPHLQNIRNGLVTTSSVVYGSTAQYSCMDGYQMDGPVNRKCTAGKLWSANEPSCRSKVCPSPLDINNGQIAGGKKLEYAINDNTTYICDSGYEMRGPAVITCLNNQTWSQTPPVCLPILCDTPPTIPNGQLVSTNFTYKSVIRYTCDEGYIIKESDAQTCQANGQWSLSLPECERILCPTPTTIEFGHVFGVDFHFGETIEYTCTHGYELVGEVYRICQGDASWSGETPDCQQIVCPELPDVENGRVDLEGLFFRNRAIYSCDVGYELVGDRRRTCDPGDKTWSGEAPHCDVITCEAPSVENGAPSAERVEYGQFVTYRCLNGYVLSGGHQLECTESGTMVGSVTRCVRIRCVQPEDIEHGSAVSDGIYYTHNITYQCDQGYQLIGQPTLKCQLNGSWSGEAPRCQITQCPDIPLVLNAQYTATTGRDFQSIVRYECREGYILRGSYKLRCQADGTWSHQPPRCQQIICPAPALQSEITTSLIRHGYIVPHDDGSVYVLGDIIVYSCPLGYFLTGQHNSTCFANMSWSGAHPRCNPIQCKRPNIDNAILSNSTFFYGSQLYISCLEGYKLEGSDSLTCEHNGQWPTGRWSDSIPSCKLVNCPAPVFVNGQMAVIQSPKAGSGYPYGITLAFRCDTGYYLMGENVLTCLGTGNWSRETPKCEPILCNFPGNLTHLSHEPRIHQFSYGEIVTLTCPQDYNLIGSGQLTCEQSGNWSGELPTCEHKVCEPMRLNNGLITTDNLDLPSTFDVGLTVYFTCLPGWRLVGGEYAACRTDQTWSTPHPTCVRVTCHSPNTRNAIYSPLPDADGQYTYGSNITINCDEGYRRNSTDASIKCGGDGQWHGDPPTCKRVGCPTPTVLDGVVNGMTGEQGLFLYGDILKVTCSSGYTQSLSTLPTCRSDGSWSEVVPHCKPVRCPQPIIENGYTIQRGADIERPKIFVYGTHVAVKCNTGYREVGPSYIKCQANATWDELPTCVRVQCPEILIAHIVLSTFSKVYLTEVNMRCQEGFDLVGVDVVRCTASGAWSDTLPSCHPMLCPDRYLENGVVTTLHQRYPSVYSHGDRVQISCEDGYHLIGDALSVCQHGPSWSNPATHCAISSCQLPDIPRAIYQLVANIDGELNGGYIEESSGSDATIRPLTSSFRPENGSRIVVSCEPGFELIGESVMTCVGSDSWIEAAPSCERLICAVPFIAHARTYGDYNIEYGGYTYGDILQVNCEEGFAPNGESSISCGPDGQWQGLLPACSQISCLPPDIDYGTFVGDPSGEHDDYIEGDAIRVTCEHGYVVTGNVILTCGEDGDWIGSVSRCKPIYCGKPVIENGYVEGDNYRFGGTVEYVCDLGYELVGPAHVNCQADGSWTFRSYCRPITCRLPARIENGDYTRRNGFKYGAVIRYRCDTGYEMEGTAERVCQTDKTWSNSPPVCRRRRCPDVSMPLNGRIITSFSQYGDGYRYYGDTLQFECEPGYSISGAHTSECLASGAWSNPVPTCELIVCEQPQPIAHGWIVGESFAAEDTITYNCHPGYELRGTRVRKCSKRGDWRQDAPTCEPIHCPAPEQINHGQVQGQNYSYQAHIMYQCNVGYHLVGHSTRYCESTQRWSGEATRCDIVECPPPTTIPHGHVTGAIYKYKYVVEYYCDAGYELVEGSVMQECNEHGVWDGRLPSCRQVVCPPPPTITDGYHDGSDYTFGAQIQYRCREDYKLVGPQTRTCQFDKEWSGPEPTCEMKQCPEPPVASHQQVRGAHVTVGSVLLFDCDRGFELHGSPRLVCTPTENWNAAFPTCEPVSCGDPPSLTEARIIEDSFVFGTTATYQCNRGYTLNGNPEIVCQENGRWSAPNVACIPISCGLPPDVSNAIAHGNIHHYGEFVFYGCMEGYELHGNNLIKCGSRGVWEGSLPRCTRRTCGPVPTIEHGSVVISQSSTAKIARYACERGYVLRGRAVIECGVDERWRDKEKPVCTPLECGPPPLIQNGWVTSPNNRVNSQATYNCNTGFSLATGSVSVIRCDYDARWSGGAPQCVRTSCSTPAGIEHGYVAGGEDFSISSHILYHCEQGYTLVGADLRTCQQDGTWTDHPPTCQPDECRAGHVSRTGLEPCVACIRGSYQSQVGQSACIPCPANMQTNQEGSTDISQCLDFHPPVIRCPENMSVDAALDEGSASVTWMLPTASDDSGQEPHISVIPDVLPPTRLPIGHTTITYTAEDDSGNQDTCSFAVTVRGSRCPPPEVPMNVIPPDGDAEFRVADEYVMTCGAGYEPAGDLNITCLPSRIWTTPTGHCTRVYCGPPEVTSRDLMVRGRGHYYGDRVVYTCRAGYTRTTPAYLTCQADGTWDYTPHCEASCKFECRNGGVCIGLNRCKCPSGYTGRFCENSHCILPCLHGGRCTSPYHCECPPGYGGKRCQQPICEQECSNGGRCVRPNRCLCPRDYKPPFCVESHWNTR